jgi:hypothetical protein
MPDDGYKNREDGYISACGLRVSVNHYQPAACLNSYLLMEILSFVLKNYEDFNQPFEVAHIRFFGTYEQNRHRLREMFKLEGYHILIQNRYFHICDERSNTSPSSNSWIKTLISMSMETKIFYADAFPHHPTCHCNSCRETKDSESASYSASSGSSSVKSNVSSTSLQQKPTHRK